MLMLTYLRIEDYSWTSTIIAKNNTVVSLSIEKNKTLNFIDFFYFYILEIEFPTSWGLNLDGPETMT